MQRLVVGTTVALLGLMAPALAVNTVNDPWDTGNAGDELNLFEIYNDLYGTNFDSTNGATAVGGGGLPADYTGGMDSLFITEDGTFIGGTGDGTAEFVARYAGFQQRFGYYTNPDGGPLSGDPTSGVSNGDFVHLFDVINPGMTVTNLGSGTIALADFPVGFFDNAPLGGGQTWYSQDGRNSDLFDHMVAYHALNADGTVSSDTFIIAFEDLRNLGDVDYNDLVVEVTIPNFNPPPDDVPEPATAALLLLGLGGAVIRRRFTA